MFATASTTGVNLSTGPHILKFCIDNNNGMSLNWINFIRTGGTSTAPEITLIDSNHTLVAVNPAQARMFGKAVGELVGKKCYREFEKRDVVCPHCQPACRRV